VYVEGKGFGGQERLGWVSGGQCAVEAMGYQQVGARESGIMGRRECGLGVCWDWGGAVG